jgi:hypothetical protein
MIHSTSLQDHGLFCVFSTSDILPISSQYLYLNPLPSTKTYTYSSRLFALNYVYALNSLVFSLHNFAEYSARYRVHSYK